MPLPGDGTPLMLVPPRASPSPERSMRNIARQLLPALLFMGSATHTTIAQSAPVPRPAPDPALRADTSAKRSNVLPVLETTAFLVALSAYDRVAYANDVQDGKKVYSATLSS